MFFTKHTKSKKLEDEEKKMGGYGARVMREAHWRGSHGFIISCPIELTEDTVACISIQYLLQHSVAP